MSDAPRATTGPSMGASGTGQRGVLMVLLVLGLAAALAAFVGVVDRRVPLSLHLGPAWLALAGALGFSVVALWGVLLGSVRAWLRGGWQPAGAVTLRLLAYVLVAGYAFTLVFLQPPRALWAGCTLGLCAGLWAALLLVAERRAGSRGQRVRRRGALARVDLALAVLCSLGLGAELALRLWASISPSPLFARADESVLEHMQRHRLFPGEIRDGFPVNSAGHYDHEFVRPADGQPALAAIGDSFSAGMVPHHYHFTTVAERQMGAGQVFNIGIPAAGPGEYLQMLRDEALPLGPDAVVFNLFVGNDLTEVRGLPGSDDRLLRWLERERLLTLVVAGRMASLGRERRALGERAGTLGEAGRNVVGSKRRVHKRAELERLFPWVLDPSREVATRSADGFLKLETRLAQEVCGPSAPPLDDLFAVLAAAREACGDTPFGVMLIPDEFQVEDGLWQAITERLPGDTLERDRPQRLLLAWLAEQGIPCLDLLPRLRAVAPLPDGQRHLYHLRDTHFNARGNQAAGEALGDFAASLLR